LDKVKSNIIDLQNIKKEQKEKEIRKQKFIGSKSEESYFKELREKMRKETGYYE